MKAMDILVLTSVYPHPDDGKYITTPTVKYFCEEWAKMGHRVVVIHGDSRFPTILYKLPRCIKRLVEKITQIQIPNIDSIKDLHYDLNGVTIFRRTLPKLKPHCAFPLSSINKHGDYIINVIESEKLNPKIIIGHWVNPQLDLLKWLKCNYNKSFYSVLVFHNDCEERDINQYKVLEKIKYIDAIGCRNYKYGQLIKKRLNLSYDPFLCWSGIPDELVDNTDINRILKNKIPNSHLYVGRLVKYKRVDSIIDALNINKSDYKFTLTIIGEGSERSLIESRIREYGFDNCVRFLNRLPRDSVFSEMSKSECFTLISENETFGMVYFEAMLMGCITIASKGCALDGIIKNKINGFLCEQGNSEELSEIYRYISNMTIDEKRNMMIQAHLTAKNYSDYNVSLRYLEDAIHINGLNDVIAVQ